MGGFKKNIDRRANQWSGPRVIVHTSEPAHGHALYVSELVSALANCGLPVVLFCPANFCYEAKVREAGVEIVHAASRDTSHAGLAKRLQRNLAFLLRAAAAQFRLLRRGDIVHFQSILHLPLGFIFLFLVSLRGGLIVLTAHDPLPHRWRFPRGLRWLERKMMEICYCLSDCIIVHNETGKQVLLRELRQNGDRIFVIPHGAYTDPGNNEAAYGHFECLHLLAFGSIRENKGFHLAIQAVQMLASHSPIPIRLTVAGSLHNRAEERYWQMCKDLIATKPDGIDVIERRISDEEIGPLLAQHHAVLLPYSEFFSESGIAVLAVSHRRPILATAAGGLAELIQQGGCGIPIESPTSKSVAEAISVAVNLGPERLRQMGLAGNNFIRKTRSWNSIARNTVLVYSQLAVGNRLSASASSAGDISASRDAARDPATDRETSVG